MTAFTIDLRADKLTIGSDTLGYVVGIDAPANAAPVGFVSKVYVAPHLRAVLFGRGIMKIGAQAMCELLLSPQLRTFDAAATALPGILRRITGAYADDEDIEDPTKVQIYEAAFGGWDAEAKRMRLMTFYNYQDYAPEELPAGTVGTMTMPVLPPSFAPNVTGLPLDKRLTAGLHAARAYFESSERSGGLSLVGGEIEMTEITAAGINIKTIGRFADYDQVRNAGAAVVSRYLRGDLDVDVRDGLVRADDMVTADTGATEPLKATVAEIAGASRAERRRAEKAARKAGRRAA